MTQLTQGLSKLIRLLEERIPANPQSPENVRRADKLENTMKAYFKSLEQAFPYDKIEKIYRRHVEEE